MAAYTLSKKNLTAWLAELLAGKTRVVGPVTERDRGGVPWYRPLQSPDELDLGTELPARSIKEFFLPPTEVLFRFRRSKAGVELAETPPQAPPTVLFGIRPCDAAAPDIVDRLMGWDYRDEPWFARREATTVVGLACAGLDRSCFCTAVGLGPDSPRGSDLMLTRLAKGYYVEVLTPKGERLVEEASARFKVSESDQEARDVKTQARDKVATNLRGPDGRLRDWLAANFEHPYWGGLALRCHGCGACACVCPTCHCFDIVDETEGLQGGTRRRNWDTCQAALFTLHGSGHNPRPEQTNRFRQRVMHKFSTYPQRFQETLCTGCGRCARVCPAGMDLPQIVGELQELLG